METNFDLAEASFQHLLEEASSQINQLEFTQLCNEKKTISSALEDGKEIPIQSLQSDEIVKVQNAVRRKINPNIPLLIKDVLRLKLEIDCEFGRDLMIDNVAFRTLTLYGNCFFNGIDKRNNKQRYVLDDGTGRVDITFSCTNPNSKAVQKLRQEYNHDYKAKDELSASLDRLLKQVEKNIYVPGEHIENGSYVSVIGVPYKSLMTKVITIHAHEMIIDNKQNRDAELFFKRNLIRFYRANFVKK